MTFQNGKCVNCDTPISTGILCRQCTPPDPHREIIQRDVIISEMNIGDFGFTAEYAIFRANGKIMVIGSAKISLQSIGYQTARIQRRNDIFEIDSQTIDPDDIFDGWPIVNEETDYFLAILV